MRQATPDINESSTFDEICKGDDLCRCLRRSSAFLCYIIGTDYILHQLVVIVNTLLYSMISTLIYWKVNSIEYAQFVQKSKFFCLDIIRLKMNIL